MEQLSRREFMKRTGLVTTGLVLIATKTAGAEVEEKETGENPEKIKRKLWTRYDEACLHMDVVARCAGIGPYSPCFSNPGEYFKIFPH